MSSALPLLVSSVLARLPLAMMSIGLLVHAQRLTGSFPAAGLAGGPLAIAQSAGGPALGRIGARRGQTLVLVASAVLGGAALVATAALPVGTSVGTLVVLAA